MTRVTNLTACSWGEGRIDVFGVDPTTGNVTRCPLKGTVGPTT